MRITGVGITGFLEIQRARDENIQCNISWQYNAWNPAGGCHRHWLDGMIPSRGLADSPAASSGGI
jgi:hypothetical protein